MDGGEITQEAFSAWWNGTSETSEIAKREAQIVKTFKLSKPKGTGIMLG